MEIEVELAQMTADFARLQFGAAPAEMDLPARLPEAYAGRQIVKQLGVEVGFVIVVVGPERLPREGALTALAAKTRDRMGAALGLIGAIRGAETRGRIAVKGAGAPGAEWGFEHGPPCESEGRRPWLLGELGRSPFDY